MPDPLTSTIGDLLRRAEGAAATASASSALKAARERMDGPLRLALAGKVKAGKSTLLNALLGEELAPTDAGECTRIVTWYHRAPHPEVVVHPRNGQPEPRPYTRASGALEVDLGGLRSADVDHVNVGWPTRRLQDLTVIDTPGLASLSVDVSELTYQALAPDDERPSAADAVLYLLRHTHATDVRFLESFHQDELTHGTSMNAVGVLARADEIGSCRLDAMEVADRIAARYQGEPRLRRLCPVIVPVAGLLGQAGETLTYDEYHALEMIAGASPAESGALLLTADRFARRASSVPVTEIEREHLLQRLGLFGVRLSVQLIRKGEVRQPDELCAELSRRSGLDRLRVVLLSQFTARSRVLKARSALAALKKVLDDGGCHGTTELRSYAEEVAAGAHEFVEVRLLNQLRSGQLDLRTDRIAELDQLLGGQGHDAASRLGLPLDAPAADVHQAALEALERWRRLAEHPLSSRPVQLAAAVATRSVEGLLAAEAGAGIENAASHL
jgi:hypothetical protein